MNAERTFGDMGRIVQQARFQFGIAAEKERLKRHCPASQLFFVLQARRASITPPLYRDNVGGRLINIDEATMKKFGDVKCEARACPQLGDIFTRTDRNQTRNAVL
jgi:hypothetical protein